MCVKTTYTTKTWSRLPKRSRGKPGNCKVCHIFIYIYMSESPGSEATRCLSASVTSCRLFCIHRHRGEIHDVGADQEGARVITTQSKAAENHYKLYHRWALNGFQPFIPRLCVCACVATCAYGGSALGVRLAFKCDTQGQQERAAPEAAHWKKQNTVFPP